MSVCENFHTRSPSIFLGSPFEPLGSTTNEARNTKRLRFIIIAMAPFRSKQSAPVSLAPPLAHNSEGPVYNKADGSIDHGVTQNPYERGFSPYEFNGGTTVAISGEDWAIVAGDSRLSSGYEILSRKVCKLHPITDHCVLGSAGCKTDVDQLRSVLDINMKVTNIMRNGAVINVHILSCYSLFL